MGDEYTAVVPDEGIVSLDLSNMLTNEAEIHISKNVSFIFSMEPSYEKYTTLCDYINSDRDYVNWKLYRMLAEIMPKYKQDRNDDNRKILTVLIEKAYEFSYSELHLMEILYDNYIDAYILSLLYSIYKEQPHLNIESIEDTFVYRIARAIFREDAGYEFLKYSPLQEIKDYFVKINLRIKDMLIYRHTIHSAFFDEPHCNQLCINFISNLTDEMNWGDISLPFSTRILPYTSDINGISPKLFEYLLCERNVQFDLEACGGDSKYMYVMAVNGYEVSDQVRISREVMTDDEAEYLLLIGVSMLVKWQHINQKLFTSWRKRTHPIFIVRKVLTKKLTKYINKNIVNIVSSYVVGENVVEYRKNGV